MPACNEYDETAHINVIYNQNIGSLTTNMILHMWPLCTNNKHIPTHFHRDMLVNECCDGLNDENKHYRFHKRGFHEFHGYVSMVCSSYFSQQD